MSDLFEPNASWRTPTKTRSSVAHRAAIVPRSAKCSWDSSIGLFMMQGPAIFEFCAAFSRTIAGILEVAASGRLTHVDCLAGHSIGTYILFSVRERPLGMTINKLFSHSVQGFAEDAANKTGSIEARERETGTALPTRHLTPCEQRAFSAALRRSVKVISRSASESERPHSLAARTNSASSRLKRAGSSKKGECPTPS